MQKGLQHEKLSACFIFQVKFNKTKYQSYEPTPCVDAKVGQGMKDAN